MSVGEAEKSFFRLFLRAFVERMRGIVGKCSLKIRKTGQAPPFWKQAGLSDYAALSAEGLWARAKRAGQVTVELLLVLPVFMLMLFCIMEIGNLAYQTILVHHCAYELARIGSLVAGPNGGGSGGGNEVSKMESTLKEMLPVATLDSSWEPRSYGPDPQAAATGDNYISYDLRVTLNYPVKLVFPGSSVMLSDVPRSQRIKKISVTVRMPIEKPFKQ
ncbi:MAG TPA: hypothetical protein DCL44_03205 [Elusimicrobia bacterium]|nr:hypothetical protein [Elusimicrobiota bacterium]